MSCIMHRLLWASLYIMCCLCPRILPKWQWMWNWLWVGITGLSEPFMCYYLWTTSSLKWINVYSWMSSCSIWIRLLNLLSLFNLPDGIILCCLLGRMWRLQYIGVLKVHIRLFEQLYLWNILLTLLWWCEYGLCICLSREISHIIWSLSFCLPTTLLWI